MKPKQTSFPFDADLNNCTLAELRLSIARNCPDVGNVATCPIILSQEDKAAMKHLVVDDFALQKRLRIFAVKGVCTFFVHLGKRMYTQYCCLPKVLFHVIT